MTQSTHVVCPHCDQVNRIPHDRLQQDPKCGGCKQVLFTKKPIELGNSNFARYITNTGLPVVVDFWASWCGPCKMMAPVFEQLAAEMSSHVVFVKVNTETEQNLAGQYRIQSIPTLALFQSGREANRLAGAVDAANLRQWIGQNLSK
ncbi:MAG TPA: thioredoxin TrxC [Acidiferrobacteraceae bacterium]|nr:thioredoxin TrxC [Acidiferrobacteraceae bacterium]